MSDPKTPLGLPGHDWLAPALRLNFDPASYVHPTWMRSVAGHELVEPMLGEASARVPLAHYLRRAFELDGSYCEDFSSPFARLNLLDRDATSDLYLHVGLALRGSEIQSQIMGAQVRALKESLGTDAYTFAVRATPLLGKIPEFTFEPEVDEPRTRFSLIGVRYLWSSLGVKPEEPLRRRARLKLPTDWEPHLASTWDEIDPDGEPRADLPRFVVRIIKEILPEWQPLFV